MPRARSRRTGSRDYPTADARRAACGEIDDAISAWTRERSSRDGFETLQAAGVPAMAVMTNEALASDPHVAARGVFVDIEHPEIGRTRVMRRAVALLRPRLRGHGTDRSSARTTTMYSTTLLGLSPDERARRAEVLH